MSWYNKSQHDQKLTIYREACSRKKSPHDSAMSILLLTKLLWFSSKKLDFSNPRWFKGKGRGTINLFSCKNQRSIRSCCNISVMMPSRWLAEIKSQCYQLFWLYLVTRLVKNTLKTLFCDRRHNLGGREGRIPNSGRPLRLHTHCCCKQTQTVVTLSKSSNKQLSFGFTRGYREVTCHVHIPDIAVSHT